MAENDERAEREKGIVRVKIPKYLKTVWSNMIELPWRGSQNTGVFDRAVERGLSLYSGNGGWIQHPELFARTMRWLAWIAGWVWSLSGLLLGAFIAPSLMQRIGLARSPYQDYTTIAIAVVVGLLIQLLAWLVMLLADWTARGISTPMPLHRLLVFTPISILLMCWPVAAVGYALYRYLTWIGPDQRAITIAFVGGLFVKVLIIPGIKTVLTGYGFKRLMAWLRDDKKGD